jgi:uncharacterized SAM-binding protein YcdF (DUF218 family)
MLDPQFCTRPTLFWTILIGKISDILFGINLGWVCGLIFLVLSAICHFRFGNLSRYLILITVISLSPLILSLVITSAPFIDFADAQLLKFPNRGAQKSDAIVILGRGGDLRRSRVKVAANLWRSQQAPIIFTSGRGDAIEMEDMLKKQAIPVVAIEGEGCSRTTAENAEFTRLMLQPQGIRKILLVTDPPHMLRSLLTFQKYGFQVTAVPSSLNANLNSRDRNLLILREYFALITYKILGRLA